MTDEEKRYCATFHLQLLDSARVKFCVWDGAKYLPYFDLAGSKILTVKHPGFV